MRLSLLTLATLAAFAQGAHAQSSVTLYGRVDANVTYQDPGSAASVNAGGPVGEAVVKLNDGATNGVGGSRWGLRGTEDLGGGLRASFVLESGFSVDSGAGSSDGLFNRQAYVGLGKKELGDLRLGRQQTLTRELDLAVADITAESELSVTEAVAAGRPLFQNFGSRVNNAVQYLSPTLAGFQVRALVAAGEGDRARQQGLSLGYAAGPLKAGLVYEAYADGPAADGSFNKVLTAGALYDFGFASLSAAYQKTEDLGAATTGPVNGGGIDHDGYNVGVLVPLGNFQVRAQYTHSTVDTVGGEELDQDKVGASVRYALSKRTAVYAVATLRGGDDDETFARKKEFVVGVGHNF